MVYTNLNIAKNVIPKINKQKIKFEIAPLDVNLAQMQLNMVKRLEREMPEYGDFAPVTETYNSNDWNLDISTIKLACEHAKDSNNMLLRRISLYIDDKSGLKKYSCPIIEGKKVDILKEVDNPKFFEICKSIVLEVDKLIKE